MKIRLFSIILLMFCFSSQASELDPVTDVYAEISNLYDPTEEDLFKIQDKLSNTKRPIVERMGDTAFIAKQFKIIGQSSNEKPEYHWIAVNSSEDEKENCIITYASFNRKYPCGVRRLVDVISHSDFRGHVHYRIGGWPNTSEGDIILAHVPYAFKVCFLREMQKKGYKRVLWLDSSILPWVSLNKIFQMIQDKGFFVIGNIHNVGPYMNEDAAAAFGLTLEQTYSIRICAALIFGIDFTNPKTAGLVEAWYQAAKHPEAFFSVRSDENALSILIYQFGLINEVWPARTLGRPGRTKDITLFLIDRQYVKPINDKDYNCRAF